MLHIKTYRFLILILLLGMIHIPGTAFAHKVMIFGWVEGDTIQTISKFSGGKRVQNAPVTVIDSNGNQLLSGKTDTKGLFSFKRPEKKTDITIILEASMGHKTTCIVKNTPDVDTANEPRSVKGDSRQKTTTKRISYPDDVLLNRVEEMMDKKMATLLQHMQETQDKRSITDIISAFGYIFGIVGVTLWLRRKNV